MSRAPRKATLALCLSLLALCPALSARAEAVPGPQDEYCELKLKAGRFVLFGYIWAFETKRLASESPEQCEAQAKTSLALDLECTLPSGGTSAGSMTEPGIVPCPVTQVKWSYSIPDASAPHGRSVVAHGVVH